MITSYVDIFKNLRSIWIERMNDSIDFAPIRCDRRKAISYWRHQFEQSCYDFLAAVNEDESEYRYTISVLGDKVVQAVFERYQFLEECGRVEAI